MGMVGPPHPGGIVKRECLEPLGLSVTRAARRVGREPAGAVGTGEREDSGVGGDGYSVVEGVWVESRDLVGDADGL